MSDLISRQVAIDALVKAIKEDPYYDSDGAGLSVCDVRVILNELPSVEPEQKTAEWIEHKYECECSSCHEEWDYCDNDVDRFIYCPNCGAKMGEDK